MTWLILALLGTLLWSISNHLDKYLLGRYFPDGSQCVLLLFTISTGVLLLPFISFLHPATLNLSLPLALLIMAGGMLYVVALWWYYQALRQAEASVVVALFQFVPVMTYALGYVILHE